MNNLHSESIRDCIRELKTSITGGLSTEEAKKRLEADGRNALPCQKKKSIFISFLSQFKDFMVIILLIAASVSFITGLYSGEGASDSVIIIAIVVLNAVIGVVQEYKAEKAIDALKELTSPLCHVKRGGVYAEINSSELVKGDIIKLSQGSIVPADCRLIEAHSLQVSEAALTGESVPVTKNAEAVLAKTSPLSERCNMLYMGTTVVLGRCEAIVCATGLESEMGKIAHMLTETEDETSPLKKKLNHTGKILGAGALLICFVIFIMGLLRHQPFFDMFMTSVSLAVAAIPEGLPAIVTIVLAIGVRKMAEKRAVVRKLPAVEALGSASVICSDKTGTLTMNKMKVTEIESEDKKLTLTLMALCSDSEWNGNAFEGEPTENALTEAAMKEGLNKRELDSLYPRVDEYPFDSSLKRMTTVHRENGNLRYITKGAVEGLLPLCTHCLQNGRTIPMTEAVRKKILAQNSEMCGKALRVISVAFKDMKENAVSREHAEYGLTFCGMAGLLDPPRPEIKSAVGLCRKAGIKPVMITGDNADTASAIAKQTGILRQGDKVITGAELDCITDKQLSEMTDKCNVFARVTPAHKVRIVNAFKSKGHIVAMTGDGINDAPALKSADIGCAMGITGTDAAKGAADIVLTDDNFATIVDAVHEGRNIYENIKKAIHFLLSSNIGEIITIFTAMIMGFASPLLPVQLLWVNLVTDSLPAIALGLDFCDEDIMEKKPNKENSLFNRDLWFKIGLEGAMIGMLALLAFAVGTKLYGSIKTGRTMCFAVLSISQLVHAFNMRSEHSLFRLALPANKYLTGSFITGTIMEVSVIQLPVLSKVFGVTPLDPVKWVWVIILCLMPLVLVELEKKLSR